MAFEFTKTLDWVDHGKRHTMGTFTNGSGDTGGDIYTGLSVIDKIDLQYKGSAVVDNEPVINETFPCHDPVTIVTDDDKDGYWHAVGT